uniref:Probable aspartyl protease At4g16563 n=1 Tax=Tanacetum cinerariifolium TaxID=118510 RepID=A0A6L2MN10_TANCI|nr:probable aspartyl protease At4g16563 [Tanacetum cinerariifolium]
MSRCPLDSIEMSECQNYTCPSFYYAYGDGSFVGKLYEDVLELPMSAPPSLTVENFTFGCAHEALAEPRVSVPQLVLHFVGNSSVVMPKKNYFYEFTDGKKVKRNMGCMTLMNAGYFPGSNGPAGLLGNYQQQGLEVVYDLLNKRVGFARRKCSSLWDTLG